VLPRLPPNFPSKRGITCFGKPVDELVPDQDDELILLNGGDESACHFVPMGPPKPGGSTRDFFLYVVGWDKDTGFQVGAGRR
jgi:hypothetical protein